MDHDYRKFESDNGNKKRSNMYCLEDSMGGCVEDRQKSIYNVCVRIFLPSNYCPKVPGTIAQDYRQRFFPHVVPSHNLPQRPSDKIETLKLSKREKSVSRPESRAEKSKIYQKMDNLAPEEVERQPLVSLSEPAKIVFSIK